MLILVPILAVALFVATGVGTASLAWATPTGSGSSAAGVSRNSLANGSLCTPEDIELGDDTSAAATDTGVATWVGRDMYIGAPTGASTYGNVAGNSSTGYLGVTPTQSYAVEAEGTTLVNGKLAIRSVKKSWGSKGFRFGIVGFGAQFRPSAGSDALVVGGSSDSAITLKDADGNSVSALGWNATGRGWIGATKSNETNYAAKLQGTTSVAMGLKGLTPGSAYPSDEHSSSENGWQSVYSYSSGSPVNWNQSNALKNVDISGVTSDYSGYSSTVRNESQTLASLSDSAAKTTYSVIDNVSGTVTRDKYNSGKISTEKWNEGQVSTRVNISATFNVNEKVIKFTGDGVSPLQIFTVPSSVFSDGSASGISFAFEKIPDGASVVVNVTGSSAVSFHNGWRFWWAGSGTLSDNWADNERYEVGNGAWWNAGDKAELYSTAAQSVMWNFANVSKLTVLGGQASNANVTANKQIRYDYQNLTNVNALQWNTVNPSNWSGQYTASVSDDPAVAMLGSIMVPNGSFEDHVTTNGRVWVGEDFMMASPTAVANSETMFGDGVGEGKSASIIDMDEERHNFPWHADMTTSCATVSWSKTDTSGYLLGGTGWAVYGSLQDAIDEKNAILLPTDNSVISGDHSDIDGVFTVQGLTPNATYFLRETNAPSGYAVNERIYQINAGDGGSDTYANFAAVYDSSGTQISSGGTGAGASSGGTPSGVTDSAAELKDGAIVDTAGGTDVTWGKVGADGTTLLSGSSWTLTKEGSGSQSWTISDNNVNPTSVEIYDANEKKVTGATVTESVGQKETFSAAVLPDGAPQTVTWSSSDPTSVSVQGGIVWVRQMPASGAAVAITATSAADPSVKAVFYVKPKAASVASVSLEWNGSDVSGTSVDLDLAGTSSLQLKVKVDPATVPVSWSSSNGDVATVDANGVVRGVAIGSAVITAKAGDKSASVTVRVANSKVTRIYFQGFEGTKAGKTPWIRFTSLAQGWGDAVQMTAACDGWYYVDVPSNGGVVQFYILDSPNWSDNVVPGGGKPDLKTDANVATWMVYSDGSGLAGAPSCSAAHAETAQSETKSSESRSSSSQTAATTLIGEAREDKSFASTTSSSAGAEDDGGAVALADEESYANSEPVDVNAEAGLVTVALADGTYTLREATAPTGHTLNETTFRFTVANGKVTWTQGDVTWADGAALIADAATEVTWRKVDAATGEALGGSTWNIEQQQIVGGASAWVTVATIADCDASSAATSGGADSGTGDGTGSGATAGTGTTAGSGTTAGAETGSAAAGSSCASGADSSGYYDADDAAGSFLVRGLPSGSYRLVESGTPSGYEPDSATYDFTVTPDAAANVGVAAAIENTKMLGTITWEKVGSGTSSGSGSSSSGSSGDVSVSSGTSHLLGGSEFLVEYRASDSAPWTSYVVADCASDSGNCAANAGAPSWARDVNPQAGAFTLAGVPWGQYRISESKAPFGYIVADGFLTQEGLVRVNAKTSVGTASSGSGSSAGTGSLEDATLTVGPGGSYTYALGDVVDSQAYTLPSTGHGGISKWVMIAGTVLAVLALLLGVVLGRKNRNLK